MKLINFILIYYVASSLITQSLGQSLPYILPCSMYEPELNDCLKRTFQNLAKYLARGLRELNVPAFDPLRIPEFSFMNNEKDVLFNLLIWNFVARGGTDIEIVEVRNNIAKLRLELKAKVPKLIATGSYSGEGKLAGYPVLAKGKFLAEFHSITSLGKIFGSPLRRSGEIYMNVDKVLVDYVVQNATFKVIDQLNPPLSEEYGDYLTSNSKYLVNATKTNAAKTIGDFFQDILQSAFSAYPLKTFIKF